MEFYCPCNPHGRVRQLPPGPCQMCQSPPLNVTLGDWLSLPLPPSLILTPFHSGPPSLSWISDRPPNKLCSPPRQLSDAPSFPRSPAPHFLVGLTLSEAGPQTCACSVLCTQSPETHTHFVGYTYQTCSSTLGVLLLRTQETRSYHGVLCLALRPDLFWKLIFTLYLLLTTKSSEGANGVFLIFHTAWEGIGLAKRSHILQDEETESANLLSLASPVSLSFPSFSSIPSFSCFPLSLLSHSLSLSLSLSLSHTHTHTQRKFHTLSQSQQPSVFPLTLITSRKQLYCIPDCY